MYAAPTSVSVVRAVGLRPAADHVRRHELADVSGFGSVLKLVATKQRLGIPTHQRKVAGVLARSPPIAVQPVSGRDGGSMRAHQPDVNCSVLRPQGMPKSAAMKNMKRNVVIQHIISVLYIMEKNM